MIFDCLNDVALLGGLEQLFGKDHVEVVQGHEEVVQVALALLERGGVAEGALIVRHGPLRGAHNAQVVVVVRVQTRQSRVLRVASVGDCLY